MPIRSALALMSLALLLTACGGGGGGGGGGDSDPIPGGAPITVSGTATFDRVPTTAASGLNYAATSIDPIRKAVVQVRSSGGTHVLYTANTAADGTFTVQAPSNATVRLVILAAMGDPADPTTKVVDNRNSNAQYAVYVTLTTAAVNLTGQDVHAASGWTGSSYGSARSAAPFAILDTACDVIDMIEGADPAAVLPDLVIGWSTGNTSATIGTSHFSPDTKRISILGHANVDTDEYDDHVIAHEIGHWFEDHFSRSDSTGGSHGDGDILDESIAFGEGFGNAFSGMATRNRYYRDTMGSQQGATALELDLEADATSDAATVGGGDARKLDGGWSEVSVQEILFDIFDGGDGTTDSDTDGVALGFTPIYQVLTGAQKTTPGFTSIYSFLTHLKAANPGSTAAIALLATNENIGTHDQFEQTGTGLKRHTVVPTNGSTVTVDVDGDPLMTYATYGDIESNFSGNKLYNWMLFTATVTPGAQYRIKATPLVGTDDLIIRSAGGITPAQVDAVFGGAERLNFTATASTMVFAVGSFANGSNPSGQAGFTINMGTPPSSIGKPTAPAPEPDEMEAPAGNG